MDVIHSHLFMNPPSHDAEGGKQNVFKKGLDKFTAKMMVQKV